MLRCLDVIVRRTVGQFPSIVRHCLVQLVLLTLSVLQRQYMRLALEKLLEGRLSTLKAAKNPGTYPDGYRPWL